MKTSTMDAEQSFDAIVIGGGFYGCQIALAMTRKYSKVLILEMGPDLLTRASLVNQARVHNGYHYPRSIVTAYSSIVNFPKFCDQYQSCIVDSFQKIYAVANRFSKVSAAQFRKTMEFLEAPIQVAPKQLKSLFNPDLIEETFLVKEHAFDAVKLREVQREHMLAAGVEIRFHTEVKSFRKSQGQIVLQLSHGEDLVAPVVFNCTYSQLNQVLVRSHFPKLPIKHEVIEMPLVRLPEAYQNLAITIMDGPFFSLMPFPSRQCHSIHHVRFTPLASWSDLEDSFDGDVEMKKYASVSHFELMRRDIVRYIPGLSDLEYLDSLRDVKTLLLANEIDDGRPILYKRLDEETNFYSVLGGKINNIYDILERIGQDHHLN